MKALLLFASHSDRNSS